MFSYVYDALGYQISSAANGETTNNLIAPFGLGNVASVATSGTLVSPTSPMAGAGQRGQRERDGVLLRLQSRGVDGWITNSAGSYVNRYSYDAFGEVTTTSAGIANRFMFVGQYGVSSNVNGLLYMRARNYDPSTGQFVSNDQLGLAGGDTDLRTYTLADPVAAIDPSGQTCYKLAEDGSRPVDDPTQGENPAQQSPTDTIFVPSPAAPDGGNTYPIYYTPNRDGSVPTGGVGGYYNDGTNWNQIPSTVFQRTPVSKDDSDNDPDCCCCIDPPPTPPPAPPNPPSPPAPCVGCHSSNQPPNDPNDLLGPSGYGSEEFLTPGGRLGYTVEFSNERTAQVPADNVIVTEQLSPNLDWSTLQLGTIGFDSYVVNVPLGLTSYSTRVDATATLGVYVEVDASLNLSTGLLTVTFTSLDPNTLDTPSNPLVGFLPPDTDPPNGEGYIDYTIQPNPGLATGAVISARRASCLTRMLRLPRRKSPIRSTPARRRAASPRCPLRQPRPASPSPGLAPTALARESPTTACMCRTTAALIRSGSLTPWPRPRPTPAKCAKPIASTASLPICWVSFRRRRIRPSR